MLTKITLVVMMLLCLGCSSKCPDRDEHVISFRDKFPIGAIVEHKSGLKAKLICHWKSYACLVRCVDGHETIWNHSEINSDVD